MAILDNTRALVDDALFRAGEIPGSSEWDTKAVEYITREYRALCAGASEFLPEVISDWWWMRSSGVLTILPTFSGIAAVIKDSAAVTLSAVPAIDLTGRYFKAAEQPDIFIIASQVGTAVTLDSPYTGPTSAATTFKATRLTYFLNANVSALLSPIRSFRENPQIMGMSPERMDTLFPVGYRSMSGVPQAFALEDEQTIRFSHGGRDDDVSMRMEYRYRPAVVDLAYDVSSIPLVPIQYRHVLSDMTLVYLYNDKNDDRLAAIGTSVRSTLGAMTRENKRRLTKMDMNVGKIFPRQGHLRRNFEHALRTESGLIIG